jgi:hypothetical protein
MPRWTQLAGLLAVALGSSAAAQPRRAEGPSGVLLPIARDQLCVTNGVVSTLPGGELGIDTASSRAVVRFPTGSSAEIRFRYLGPSAESKPLASGEMRRQIGLKLRAQDTCNLLYAMWHIEPDARIAVSIKRNIGKRLHEQCGAHGYVNIRPVTSVQVPRVLPGESHRFRAELRGTDLIVFADERLVWKGSVGSQVLEFDGPVGLRTDNARFAFAYLASSPGGGDRRQSEEGTCLKSPGD